MKRALIGLASEWYSPPERLLTTIANFAMIPWFVISIMFILLGIV